MELPVLSGTNYGFDWEIKNLKLSSLSVEPPLVTFAAGTGLKIDAGEIHVKMDMDYDLEGSDWWNPFWSSGSILVKFDGKSFATGSLGIAVADTGYPDLTFSSQSVQLNMESMDVSGSFFNGLFEVLGSLMRGSLEEAVESAVQAALDLYLTNMTTAILADIPLVMPLPLDSPYNETLADFTLCEITAAENYLAFGVRGAFSNNESSSWVYSVEPPALPEAPPSDFESHMFSLSATNWVANGAAWFLQKQGFFSYDIRDASVLPLVPLLLNSSEANELELNQSYAGPMSVKMRSLEAPQTKFSDDGSITLRADSRLEFSMAGAPGLLSTPLVLQAPLAVTMSAGVAGGSPERVRFKLKALSVTPASVILARFPVTPKWLNRFLAVFVKEVLTPLAKSKLKTEFELGTWVRNASIDVTSDRAIAFADVEFNISSTPAAMRSSAVALMLSQL